MISPCLWEILASAFVTTKHLPREERLPCVVSLSSSVIRCGLCQDLLQSGVSAFWTEDLKVYQPWSPDTRRSGGSECRAIFEDHVIYAAKMQGRSVLVVTFRP